MKNSLNAVVLIMNVFKITLTSGQNISFKDMFFKTPVSFLAKLLFMETFRWRSFTSIIYNNGQLRHIYDHMQFYTSVSNREIVSDVGEMRENMWGTCGDKNCPCRNAFHWPSVPHLHRRHTRTSSLGGPEHYLTAKLNLGNLISARPVVLHILRKFSWIPNIFSIQCVRNEYEYKWICPSQIWIY